MLTYILNNNTLLFQRCTYHTTCQLLLHSSTTVRIVCGRCRNALLTSNCFLAHISRMH